MRSIGLQDADCFRSRCCAPNAATCTGSPFANINSLPANVTLTDSGKKLSCNVAGFPTLIGQTCYAACPAPYVADGFGNCACPAATSGQWAGRWFGDAYALGTASRGVPRTKAW